jgi:hypothetical protein
MVACLNLTIDRELNGLKVGSCVNKVGLAADSGRYPPHQGWEEAFVSGAVGIKGGLDSETKVGEEEVDLRDELGGKEGHGRHVRCNGGSAGLTGLHGTRKLKFVENYPYAHNYVVKSKYPVGLVGLLISGDMLKQMLENDGYVHKRKQQDKAERKEHKPYKQQDTSIRKQQDTSIRKQQDTSIRKQQDTSKRPTKKAKTGAPATLVPRTGTRKPLQGLYRRRSEKVPRGQDERARG